MKDLQHLSDCYIEQLESDAEHRYHAVGQRFHSMLKTPPAAMPTARTPVVGPPLPCASFCVLQNHRPLPPPQPYGDAKVFFDASTRARGRCGDATQDPR